MLPRFRFRLFCILLSLALVAGCKIKLGDDTGDANKIIDEVKTGIAAADKMSQEAYTKFRSYMNEETMDKFPSNREQLRPTIQESADLFGKSAVAYREQSNKLAEATKLNINDKFKEYIKLKVEAFKKLAESKEVAKELAQTPLDSSLTTQAALVAKVQEVDARLNAAVKQHQELNDQANKLQADNPDIILKSSQ